MKTRITLTSLLLYLTLTSANVFGSFYRPADDTIVGRTKRSVLIVAGKVTDVQSDHLYGAIYTDVTITVSKALKGEPNIDKNTVRFRVEGGTSAGEGEFVSTVREFPIGDELILFIYKRDWRDWAYNGLYPMMHCYPKIVKLKVDGQTHEVVWFHLSFFGDQYSMNLPVELAFRFIENAEKAPEEVALLEEKIRAIKDIQAKEHEVSSAMFLLMLKWELTKIEARIKAKENRDKPPPYVIDVQKLAGATPETADQLLKEMVPSKLMMECRLAGKQNDPCLEIVSCWEVAKGEVPDISLRINSRYYDIDNGQISQEGTKPKVILKFDAPDQEQVSSVTVRFSEYLDTTDVLRRLGYDATKQITHHLDPKLCFFYTERYLHEVVRHTEQPTEVSVYLRAWED